MDKNNFVESQILYVFNVIGKSNKFWIPRDFPTNRIMNRRGKAYRGDGELAQDEDQLMEYVSCLHFASYFSIEKIWFIFRNIKANKLNW